MRLLRRFNRWYDAVPEPDRLFLFVGLLSPMLAALQFGPPPLNYVVAATWAFLMISVRYAGK